MSIITRDERVGVVGVALRLVFGIPLAQRYRGPHGFGTTPSQAELVKIDIDVMPDGRRVPAGAGCSEAKQFFQTKCVTGHGGSERREVSGGAALSDGHGARDSGAPAKTVASYRIYRVRLRRSEHAF